ncbi:MAG: response regulator [Planctomycetes bacterium]|nr:response regulator [Planctomycetota bacterium]
MSTRLTAVVLGLMATSTLVFTVERRHAERSQLEEQIQDVGTTLATTLALACPDVIAVEDVDYALLETYATELVRQRGVDVAFVVIAKANGKTLATHGTIPSGDDPGIRVFETPIVLRPSERQLGYCRVGVRVDRWHEHLAARWQRLATELLGGSLAVALLLFVLLRRMVGEPLQRLDADARRIGAGDLTRPIQWSSDDELGRLAATLDRMRSNLDRSHCELADQNSRLQELDQMKNQFLANISHEMRTPLAAILGNLELLTTPDADRGESLLALRRNTDALLCTVNQILDMSKLQGGQLHIERRPIRIRETLETVIAGLQPVAIDKGLEIRLHALPMPDWLVTDGLRLRQILRAVLENAVKFSEHGTIEVMAVIIDPAPGRLTVSIADHGPGIPREQQTELFTAFTTGDGSLTRRHGGVGLGLVTARALTRALGGELTLTSVPGSGTTVRIELPVTVAPQPETHADVDERAGNTVLVVDDAPDIRRLVQAILNKAGFSTCVAENGVAACMLEERQRQAGRPFDIVVMDIQMPVMDGCQAARRMREQGRNQPILALTAHATADDRTRCLAAGFDDYATKPIGRDQLVALVRQHLRTAAPVN